MSSHESLADQAYRSLKQAVITYELEAGSQVSESDLVARFGLGRAAVRSALVRLAQDGLVDPIPRQGHRIRPIRIQDVIDVFEVRELMEPAAVGLAAARRSPEQVEEFLRIAGRFRDALPTPDDVPSIVRFLAIDKHFHLTVVAAAGNPRMTRVIGDLLDASERHVHLALRVMTTFGEIEHAHTDLVEALVAGDAAAAEELTRTGLVRSRRITVDALEFVSSGKVSFAGRALGVLP